MQGHSICDPIAADVSLGGREAVRTNFLLISSLMSTVVFLAEDEPLLRLK